MNGIDISRYQGKPDFSQVRNAVDFVIVQAGYGKYSYQIDKEFERNYSECKKHKIPVGTYWFSYAKSAAEATQEARTFIETIKGKQFEFPLYYDIEGAALSGDVAGKCEAFCSTLERAGYYAGIYISRSPAEQYLKNTTVSKKYTMWIAEYSSINYSGAYDIWQKSDSGRIAGIETNVDIDVCYVDFPKIIKEKGLNGFPKPAVSVLDSEGWKYKDDNQGVYLLKQILKTAYKRNLNDDSIFGKGTENAVNSILSANGFKENGIAGMGFCDLITKGLKK